MVDFNFFLIGSSCCVSAIRLEGVTDDCCVSFSLGLFVDAGGSGFFVDEVVDDDLLKKLISIYTTITRKNASGVLLVAINRH